MPAVPDAAPTLDGRTFAMVSSTASRVDARTPTVFCYHEDSGLVWGDYHGDTVEMGRFVGRRVGFDVQIAFSHVLASTGDVITGDAVSRVRWAADGALELVEKFGHQGEHVSVCREVA